MKDVPVREVGKGVAAALLALLPAYFSYPPQAGLAGMVTAIAYAIFTLALILVAFRYFSASRKRRRTLFKMAWNVTIVGFIFLLAVRIVPLVQQ